MYRQKWTKDPHVIPGNPPAEDPLTKRWEVGVIQGVMESLLGRSYVDPNHAAAV